MISKSMITPERGYLKFVFPYSIILLLLNTFTLYSQEFRWSQVPVEKYKYFINKDKSIRKEFAGVGKLFVSFDNKNIEFIGLEYKDKSIAASLYDTTNTVFNFAFSEYEIERITRVDNYHFKFDGREKFYGRRIDGFIKTKKVNVVSMLSTCEVVDFELFEYSSDNESLFNYFALVNSEVAKGIMMQLSKIYFGDRSARCY